MRMRGVAAAVLCAAVAAGCSSSGKASAPSVAAGAGLGQVGPPSGITAGGSARQTVPADLAFVVVGLSGNGGNGLNPTIIGGINGAPVSVPTENPNTKNPDHKAIRAAITALGLPEGAVDFSAEGSGFSNGDSVVEVEVPVAKLPKIAHDVVDAIRKSGATIGGQGLRLAVRDCAAALTSARTKAVENARADAQRIADAGGVSLGQLVSVSEAASSSSSVLAYVTGGANPCGRGEVPTVNAYRPRLASLDAPARVDLTESVAASFALRGATNRSLSAIGQGDATGPADGADILFAPENGVVFGSDTPTSTIDEARVVSAVRPFGIDEKDVEVENPPNISVDGSFAGSSYVRVHVTIPQLTKSGHEITAAIQSAVHAPAGGDDSSGTVGVLFEASNCRDLQKQARAAAAADARRRIDKLASVAHVHAGAVTGLTESSAVAYFPVVDPCEFHIDDLADVGALSGSSYPGIPKLANVDAAPEVTVQASLEMTRALS